MPTIKVEFFGIPRERAGTQSLTVEATSIQELLAELTQRLPEFGERCLQQGRLKSDYLLSINGKHFTRDENTQLIESDSVLILSADVGG